MDQYLLPFYKKWIQDGNSQDEAVALLVAFYKLLDSYGDGSCALNFGPDFNELTGAMLKAEKTGRFRSPIVAVRMREDTPNEIYDQYIDKMLFEIGQPTFYGENPCVKSMEYRGNSKREGHSINSCMGMVVVGREIADMWGCCVNMNIPLELAVNCGKPLHGEFPQMLQKYLEGVSASVPRSMDDIRNSFARYIRKIVAYVANQNKQKAAWVAMHRPNPMLSLLLDDCIEFGRDRAHSGFHALGDKAKEFMENDEFKFIELRKGRGVRYHNVTVLATGFADVADSMSAIDELVYKQHKYTLEDIMEAARNNYEGSERVSKIYVDLKRCPKYANGSRVADINAAFVLDALADACEDEYTGNIRYLPTCHTIDSNVLFGNCVYASMDSRKDGEAFAKNAGPVLSVLKNTPTDLMWSASKLPQVRFSGGMPIDLYVMENLLSTKENCEKFRGLLKVYFEMGGMQVQVNSVNVELLKQAYNEPEKYPNVIVRKGGFSMYFTDMPKVTQKDMIERFEKESRS
jgi:formate C-acetyltransferase